MGKKGMPSFTRGGLPVKTTNPVHAHPKQRKGGEGRGKSFDAGQIAAITGAGIATGALGALTVAVLREGFGGGNGRFGPKGR